MCTASPVGAVHSTIKSKDETMGWFRRALFVFEKQMLNDISKIALDRLSKWEKRVAAKDSVLFPKPIETVEVQPEVIDVETINVPANDLVDKIGYDPNKTPRIPNLKRYYADQKAKKRNSADVIRVDFVAKAKAVPNPFMEMFEARLREIDITDEEIRIILRGINDPEYYKTLEPRFKNAVDCYFKYTK